MNSDPDRIEEFVDYYEWNKEENKIEDKGEFETLAELIFNSVEDGFAMGVVDADIKGRLGEFIKEHAEDFPTTLDYWISLESPEWKDLTSGLK